MSTLAVSDASVSCLEGVSDVRMKELVANLLQAQEELHKRVSDKVKRNHSRQRRAASRGQLPQY